MARRALELAEAAPDATTTPGVSLRVGITINLAAILAQRGDAATVQLVDRAITLCEAEGPPDQLAVCMPEAARHCWDVGAVTEARAYLDRSWALLGEGRRIAHADLLTAATAVALGDGDLDAAVEHGTAAEAEAAGLGHRPQPAVRARPPGPRPSGAGRGRPGRQGGRRRRAVGPGAERPVPRGGRARGRRCGGRTSGGARRGRRAPAGCRRGRPDPRRAPRTGTAPGAARGPAQHGWARPAVPGPTSGTPATWPSGSSSPTGSADRRTS